MLNGRLILPNTNEGRRKYTFVASPAGVAARGRHALLPTSRWSGQRARFLSLATVIRATPSRIWLITFLRARFIRTHCWPCLACKMPFRRTRARTPSGVRTQLCQNIFLAKSVIWTIFPNMDWQQITALLIVATTAGIFIWTRVRPAKFDFRRHAPCGCSSPSQSTPQHSMVFRARKGETPQILVKMK
jgi:hypothetical protein